MSEEKKLEDMIEEVKDLSDRLLRDIEDHEKMICGIIRDLEKNKYDHLSALYTAKDVLDVFMGDIFDDSRHIHKKVVAIVGVLNKKKDNDE